MEVLASCEEDLTAPNAPVADTWAGINQERFDQIISYLHQQGLENLTEAYDQDLIRVSFSPKPPKFRADVSWRTSFIGGRRFLSIRNLSWDTEVKRQQVIWKVALALFNMELKKRLWSIRDMIPSNPSISLRSYNLPSLWRDSRLADISGLEKDLYTLVGKLNLLSAENLLPARDPGRRHFRRSTTFPNLEDFGVHREFGPEAIDQINFRRYSKSVLVSYYLDWAKRLAVVGVIAGGSVGGYLEWNAETPATMTLEESATLREMSLERAVRVEEGRILDPDPKKIDQLNKELEELRARNDLASEAHPSAIGK